MDVSKRRTLAKRTHARVGVQARAGRWQAVAAEDVRRRQCDCSDQAAGGLGATYTLSLCQVAVFDTKTRAAVPVVQRNLWPFHLGKSWRLQLRPFGRVLGDARQMAARQWMSRFRSGGDLAV